MCYLEVVTVLDKNIKAYKITLYKTLKFKFILFARAINSFNFRTVSRKIKFNCV